MAIEIKDKLVTVEDLKTVHDYNVRTYEKKTYDKYCVLVVAGQSNAVGYDESPEYMDGLWYTSKDVDRIKQLSCRSAADNTVSSLGRTAKAFQNMDTFGKDQTGTKGIHMPLANLIVDKLPKDYGLLIVPCAYGDTGFTRTSKSGYGWQVNSGMYNLLVDKTKAALDLNAENKMLGVVWIQGEADEKNAAGHYTAFQASTQAYFTEMTQTYGDRLTNGKSVWDKDMWFNVETIFWWYNREQNRQIWDNYKTWNENTYVAVTTSTLDSNNTNGCGNQTAGRTSSVFDSHYGNNAYARKVAPAVFAKMCDMNCFGTVEAIESSSSEKRTETAILSKPVRLESTDVSQISCFNANTTLSYNIGTVYANPQVNSMDNNTKWQQNSQTTFFFNVPNLKIFEFIVRRPQYWLITHGTMTGDYTIIGIGGNVKNLAKAGVNKGLYAVNSNHHPAFTLTLGATLRVERKDDGKIVISQKLQGEDTYTVLFNQTINTDMTDEIFGFTFGISGTETTGLDGNTLWLIGETKFIESDNTSTESVEVDASTLKYLSMIGILDYNEATDEYTINHNLKNTL